MFPLKIVLQKYKIDEQFYLVFIILLLFLQIINIDRFLLIAKISKSPDLKMLLPWTFILVTQK